MNVQIHPRSTRAAEGLSRRRFTVAEIEAFVAAGVIDHHERVELIGGELVPMSPKGLAHEVVKQALSERWYRQRDTTGNLAVATTFRLSEDTYLEPDIVIFPRALGFKGLSGPNVLLVVEIADTSLRYDRGRKAKLFASFGVRELWSLDAVKLTARVFRTPSKGGYAEIADFTRKERLVPAFAPEAFSLRLDELDLR